MSLSMVFYSFRILILLLPVFVLVACGTTPRYTTVVLETEPGPVYIKPAQGTALPEPLKTNAIQIHEYQVPRFHRHQLSNGIQVYLLENHKLPQVRIAALVEAGSKTSRCNRVQEISRHDSQYLAPLVVKLLKRGTENYSEEQFEKLNSQLGEGLKYSLNARFSIITANLFPYDIERALALLADSITASQVGIPVADLNQRATVLHESIHQLLIEKRLQQSSGRYWTWHRFYQENYPLNHPYYEVDSDGNNIKRTGLNDVRRFYKNCYTPVNTRLIIAGDFEARTLMKLLNHYFSHWSPYPERSALKLRTYSPPDSSTATHALNPGVEKKPLSKLSIIHRPGAKQANILFARVTVAGQSEDYIPLVMLARLLGGGPDSRLFADLRERQGLTYAIGARQLSGLYRQPFYIQTSVAHEKLGSMISGINRHLDYLCKVPVSPDELQRVKQQMSGELLLEYQTNTDFINNKIKGLNSGFDSVSINDMLLKINSVNTDSIHRVTRQYLCGERHYYIAADQDKLGDLIN